MSERPDRVTVFPYDENHVHVRTQRWHAHTYNMLTGASSNCETTWEIMTPEEWRAKVRTTKEAAPVPED